MVLQKITIILLFAFVTSVCSKVKFKLRNIECNSNSQTLAEVKCFINASRNSAGKLYILAQPLKPVTSLLANIRLFRWYNGFTPFNNITVDICKIFTKRATAVETVLAKLLATHSNVNHTCPITHKVLVDGVETDLSMIPSILEPGSYRVTGNFSSPKTNEWFGYGQITLNVL